MQMIEILKELRIPFKTTGDHHCTTGWAQTECPHCGKGSGKLHLGFNLATGHCNCWRCGPQRAGMALSLLSNRPYGQIRGLLKDLAVDKRRDPPERGQLKLPYGLGPLQGKHRSYIRRRGLDPDELVQLWAVQGIGISVNKLSWRIFIPISLRGEVVSWTARSIGSGVGAFEYARYISASPLEEIVDHKSLLYGEDYSRHSIIICEGPIDVWAIGPGAVASFGTGFTKAQINRMAHYPRRAVCFDSEARAQQRARALCKELEVFEGETYNIVLESGKDPAEANKTEIKELRKFLSQ